MTAVNPKILTNIGKSLSSDGAKLQKRLAEEGFPLVSAADPAALLKAAIKEKPDILLINPNKKGTNGIDLCRKLAANRKTASIPVAFAALKASSVEVAEALEAGAAEYLTKPFRHEEVVARLRRLVRKQKAQPAQKETPDCSCEIVDELPAL